MDVDLTHIYQLRRAYHSFVIHHLFLPLFSVTRRDRILTYPDIWPVMMISGARLMSDCDGRPCLTSSQTACVGRSVGRSVGRPYYHEQTQKKGQEMPFTKQQLVRT